MNADIQTTLTQIVIYPIKSLDGMIVDRAKVATGGALKFDRRWAIVDAGGKVVNAKRTAKVQQLRSRFNLTEDPTMTIETRDENTSYTFCLTTELTELASRSEERRVGKEC